MPRYIVERTFPERLHVPLTDQGASGVLDIVGRNAELGVTWVQSFVSDDKTRTFCVYDAPDPESIRVAADRNGLPVQQISRVSVLDPYFYR